MAKLSQVFACILASFMAVGASLLLGSPALAGDIIPPKSYATTPGGVNVADGSLVHSVTDLAIGTLKLERSHRTGSQQPNNPMFGKNFASNFDIYIAKRVVVGGDADFLTAHLGSSASGMYIQNKSTNAIGPNNLDAEKGQLSYNGTQYIYIDSSGTTYTFSATVQAVGLPFAGQSRKIEKIDFPDGSRRTFSYNASGYLKLVEDSTGYAMVFDYDANGDVTAACAFSRAQSFVSAASTCSGAQLKVTYAYTTLQLVSVTDVLGQVTTYTNTLNGITCMKPPGYANCKMSLTYSGARISTQTLQDGGTWTVMGSDPTTLKVDDTPAPFNGHNEVSVTDPANVTINLTFTKTSPFTMTDANGRLTQFLFEGAVPYTDPWQGYSDGTMLREAVFPEGDKYQAEYIGPFKAVTKETKVAKPGSGLPDLVKLYGYAGTCTTLPNTYQNCAKPLWVRDPKGNQTDYTYAVHGGILTETLPAPLPGGVRPQKRYSYAQFTGSYKNAAGTQTPFSAPVWLPTTISECKTLSSCAGTNDEMLTTFTYGAAGTLAQLMLTEKTVRSGNLTGTGAVATTTKWTYNANGDVLTEDGPLPGTGDTAYTRYDILRRVVGKVTPDPDGTGALKHRAVRNTYDTAGRLTKVERGTVNSPSDTDWAAFAVQETLDTAYDLMDRKLREFRSAGGTTYALSQYSYDALGRLECSAVRMNPAAYASLPASACTLGTEGTNGPDRITKLTYNAAGELTKTTLAVGTPQQADDETNSYTLNGKLATVTDGENNTTTFEYDGHDRLSKTRYPVAAVGALASSTTDYEGLSYDANGNVITRRLRDGQLHNLTYDNLNRLTLKDVPNTVYYENDTNYTYDLMGRTTFAGNTTTRSVWYSYDALGRMTSEAANFGTTSRAYDAAGRLTTLTHPDGFFVNYDYDTTGNITKIRENGATTGTGVLATYSYDDYGRRISLTRGNGTVTTTSYDGVSRMTGFTHDLTGTIQDLGVTGFTYNPANQILGYTRSNDSYAWKGHYNVSRAYGTNGLNQLTSAGATALGYDLRGNLTASGASAYTYTSENRLATGPGGAALAYDSVGRLSQVYTPALSTNFDYDGTVLIGERDQISYALLRRYVHGPGEDQPLVWYEGAGLTDKRYLMTDERGSVVAVTNNTGAASSINSYDEYGIPASTNMGRFGYTGQTWIPEIGLNYYKARMYSPTLGRFMQTDPIGYGDGINWYDYVDGDPVNRVDPDGQVVQWLVKLVKTGVKEVAKISTKKAIEVAKKGGNIKASTKQEAKKIAVSASKNPKLVEKHRGHELKNSNGKPTGEVGRPHYHTGNDNGGHIFWSAAAATAGFVGDALDVADQIFNPFYVTEMGKGTLPPE